MNIADAPLPAAARFGRREHGIVLLVALVVLALMVLSCIALMRAVDTATAVVGNLTFRETTIAPATAAIEDALAALSDGGVIGERERDLPARGYYASRQAQEDTRGVPLVLQPAVPGADGVRTLEPGNGITVRYVMERLCAAAGPATAASCHQVVTYVPGASATEPAPRYTVYRVTARLDGPQGAAAFVQMMLRDSSPPRRISWRVIEE